MNSTTARRLLRRACSLLIVFSSCYQVGAAAEAAGFRLRALDRVNSFVVAPGTSQQLTAFVQRTDGTPVPGVVLQFTAPPQGASGVFPDSEEPGQRVVQVTSDSQGVAAATFVTNGIPGVFLVGVSLEGSAARTGFAFTNTLEPPDAAMEPTAVRTAVQDALAGEGEVIGLSVLVHGPVLLPAGAVITPAWPESSAARTLPAVIEKPAWLLWTDDLPFADFGHPTRFIVIDAAEKGPDVMARAEIRAAHSWPLVHLPGDPTVHPLSLPTEAGFAVEDGTFAPAAQAAFPPFPYRAAAPDDACALLVFGPDLPAARTDILNQVKFLRDNQLVAPQRIFGNVPSGSRRMQPVTKTRLAELIQFVARQGCKKVYFMFVAHGIPPELGGGVAVVSEREPGKSTILSPQEYVDLLKPLGNVELCILQISCYAGWVTDWIQGHGFTGTVIAASSATEPAYNDGGGGHFFFNAFRAAKINPAADKDGDGKVSDPEALDWVREHDTSPFTFPNGEKVDRIQTADPQGGTISPVGPRKMKASFLFLPSPGSAGVVWIERPSSVPLDVAFPVKIRIANEGVATAATDFVLPPFVQILPLPVAGKDCGETLYQVSATVNGQRYDGESRIQVGHFRPDPMKLSIPAGDKVTVKLELYGGVMRSTNRRDSTPTQFVLTSRDASIAAPDQSPVDVPVRAASVTFTAKGLKPGTTQFDIMLLKTRSVKTIEVRVFEPDKRTSMNTCDHFSRRVAWNVLGVMNPFQHPISLPISFEGGAAMNAEIRLSGQPPEFVDLKGEFDCESGALSATGNSGDTAIAGYKNVPAKAEGTLVPNATDSQVGSSAPFTIRRAADNGATIQITYTLGEGVFPGGPISWTLRGDVEPEGGCAFTLELSTDLFSRAGGSGTVFIATGPGCGWTASSDAAWLALEEPADGAGPAALAFRVEPNASADSRTANITIAGVQAAVTQDGTGSARPVIHAAGVVNGASFAAGIASGSWISVLGSNFAPADRVWGAADFDGPNLPTSLDGVSVTVNGRPAYVFYIGPTQLNVLVPDDETAGAVRLVVTTPNGSSDPYEVYKAPVDPALFLFGPENRRYAAAVHADGTLVGKEGLFPGAVTRPALPGEVILLFGTGFGRTDPPVPSAQLVAQAARLARPVVVRIGGRIAEQTFAGLSASGLNQFNVVIPELGPGDHLVEIFIDGVPIQPGVHLTVGE